MGIPGAGECFLALAVSPGQFLAWGERCAEGQCHGRKEAEQMLGNGCSSQWDVWVCSGNFLGCCPEGAGDGEGRFWWLGVHCAALPSICFSSGIFLAFSRASPHRREENSPPVFPSIPVPPFSLALCPGHCPWCEDIAWSALEELCRLPGLRKQSQAQETRLRSHGPSERDWPNLSCVTFQPGICLSQLREERKRSERFSLLCGDKCVLFLSCCSFI